MEGFWARFSRIRRGVWVMRRMRGPSRRRSWRGGRCCGRLTSAFRAELGGAEGALGGVGDRGALLTCEGHRSLGSVGEPGLRQRWLIRPPPPGPPLQGGERRCWLTRSWSPRGFPVLEALAYAFEEALAYAITSLGDQAGDGLSPLQGGRGACFDRGWCGGVLCSANTPDWIRTSNLRFRRPMLYPVELRVRRLSRRVHSRLLILTRHDSGGKTIDGQLTTDHRQRTTDNRPRATDH
jgi:hypothetical protein